MNLNYLLRKLTIRRIKNKIIRTLFNDQWSILVCGHNGTILRHIEPPKDRFWADPFPVEVMDKTYIFLEQQIGSGNGTLGFIELYPDLTYSGFIPILEKSYHLSYPNIFSYNNNWYLVPESHENRTIDLYEALEFPHKWEYKKTLIKNIDANDTTVFYYDSMWWLFTSVGTNISHANANLSIFYSDSLFSDNWISHPKNPISKKSSNSRMAGNIFTENNKLFRPAQNCKADYGKELNINEITELGPSVYKEQLSFTIKPDKKYNAVCTHTINYSKSYVLRDIKTRKSKIHLW
jgi:hypothetical protein